ncbi:MAG: hypothetical protein ACFFBD_15055 [Candidatus Hodarchaeota archaeon]
MKHKFLDLPTVILVFLIFLSIISTPNILAIKNRTTVVWTEGQEIHYRVDQGSGSTLYLGTLSQGDTFKMILGGTADIHAPLENCWNELLVQFQRTNSIGEGVGSVSSKMRPYLSTTVALDINIGGFPNDSTAYEDIPPPFFIWLVRKETNDTNGEVHSTFSNFSFFNATYDHSVGYLTFVNASGWIQASLGNLVIETYSPTSSTTPTTTPTSTSQQTTSTTSTGSIEQPVFGFETTSLVMGLLILSLGALISKRWKRKIAKTSPLSNSSS